MNKLCDTNPEVHSSQLYRIKIEKSLQRYLRTLCVDEYEFLSDYHRFSLNI